MAQVHLHALGEAITTMKTLRTCADAASASCTMQGATDSVTHHCKRTCGRYQFFSALAHTILAWEAGGPHVCPSTLYTTESDWI